MKFIFQKLSNLQFNISRNNPAFKEGKDRLRNSWINATNFAVGGKYVEFITSICPLQLKFVFQKFSNPRFDITTNNTINKFNGKEITE